MLAGCSKDDPDESPTARVEWRPVLILYPLQGVAEAALYCARHSHPPNPERAETRSRPRRAHSYRARSASKKGTWLLPSLLAGFFSILLENRVGERLTNYRIGNMLPRHRIGAGVY